MGFKIFKNISLTSGLANNRSLIITVSRRKNIAKILKATVVSAYMEK